MEWSLEIEKLLLAFLDALYKRCLSIFGGVLLPIKAFRCFFLLGSPSTIQGNRGLAFGYLPVGHIPFCQ